MNTTHRPKTRSVRLKGTRVVSSSMTRKLRKRQRSSLLLPKTKMTLRPQTNHSLLPLMDQRVTVRRLTVAPSIPLGRMLGYSSWDFVIILLNHALQRQKGSRLRNRLHKPVSPGHPRSMTSHSAKMLGTRHNDPIMMATADACCASSRRVRGTRQNRQLQSISRHQQQVLLQTRKQDVLMRIRRIMLTVHARCAMQERRNQGPAPRKSSKHPHHHVLRLHLRVPILRNMVQLALVPHAASSVKKGHRVNTPPKLRQRFSGS